MVKRCFLISSLILLTQLLFSQSIKILQQGKPCSIRGLSVLNNKIAWISGSKGHVAITIDGGKTWKWEQVKGFEQSDFRDIEAFSGKKAITMSSGTPALILKTIDGGENWKVVYRNDSAAYFLDAMTFVNSKTGYILGDPINRKFLLLKTTDGGESWKPMYNTPVALPGEAAFAASGTCIHTINKKGNIEFVTGGTVSRLLFYNPEKHWAACTLPLAQGQASKGAFSISSGKNQKIIVGGDYQKNKNTDSTACYSGFENTINKTQTAEHPPAGYQSCVTYINRKLFLSTGTSGTNLTNDGGKNWNPINANSFNVCVKAKRGNFVLLAGDQGKIALFKNQ